MSLSFNPTGDLTAFDGLESVTLRQPAGAPVEVTSVLRRRDMCGEAEASDGQYTATDVDWHLPADQLADEPVVGAVIADAAGTRFVIQSVARTTMGARWVCRSRNLAILSGLDVQVALQQGTWSKGPSGDRVAVWHNVRINLAARIQPQQSEMTIEYDRRLTRVTHRIFVADDIVVDHTYRVVAGSAVYRILGYERPSRIDALAVILAAQTSGEAT